jgi:hypothetical protein
MSSEGFSLICHSETPCAVLRGITVVVQRTTAGDLCLTYTLTGELARVRIPAPQAPAARDGLWQHTCLEVFVSNGDGNGYREFNFSPSGQWAAYGFTAYRQRGEWVASQPPAMTLRQTGDSLVLVVMISAADLPVKKVDNPGLLGLTAVIEAVDGSKSYWALRHPAGQPDFHHRDGFVHEIWP